MKIECSKEKISTAVRKVEKIAQKHQTLPVLSCILFIAEKGILTLRATNLEVGIEVKVPVKMEKEGTCAIPAQIFSSCISGINGDKISLELVDGVVSLSSTDGDFKIKTFPHEDFPNIPLVSEDSVFSIQTKDLIEGIKSVSYSAAISSMKPELSSVYIYSDNIQIYFVATDSFRLAEKKIPLKKKIPLPAILIPFKNAGEVVRVFEAQNEEVECHVGKNQISFITEDTHLTSRVVNGVFPDYKQIIPKESTTEVVVLKDDLVKTLRLTTLFSDKFNQVRLIASPKKNDFEIVSKNSDTGEAKQSMKATMFGEESSIGFNHRYIVDGLQSIDVESVSLAFAGPQRPMVVRGASDPSFTYIVMPMNR